MTGPDAAVTGQPSSVIWAAAALYLVLGFGFGAGAVATLAALARDGELPMTPWGLRSMAGGPFEL